MITLTKAEEGEAEKWGVGANDTGHRWHVTLQSTGGKPEKKLSFSPVDLDLATGIAEDYCERLNTLGLIDPSAAWRSTPASRKQIDTLKKLKVEFEQGVTKGEASDMITQAVQRRNRWKGQPATEPQLRALRYLGYNMDQIWTKGTASKAIADAKCR